MVYERRNLAPVCLFAYNRPDHLSQALISLSKNNFYKESEIFIFSDGPKNEEDSLKVEQVRKIISNRNWGNHVNIVKSEKNKGLAESIIEGISEIIGRFGQAIILEDDLVLSPCFLDYMNKALRIFENEQKVMHISGYMYPVRKKLPETFFLPIMSCWGWATWKRAWDFFNDNVDQSINYLNNSNNIYRFNFYNSYDFYSHLIKNKTGEWNTWAIKWYSSIFYNNGLCLYPGRSLVRNIGMDNSGEHCGHNDKYLKQDLAEKIQIRWQPVGINIKAERAVRRYLEYQKLKAKISNYKNVLKNFYTNK